LIDPGKMTMKLAGDLAEFSLADLIQVAGVAGRTCRVRVMAADGNGTLYLRGGEVVSAEFEDLAGFDAFVGLVAARAGHFQVENGVEPEQPNLQGNVQKLLLEANARIESGKLPRPQRRPLAPPAAPAAAAPGSRARGAWIGGVAVLLLLGAVSWLALARRDVAAVGDDAGASAAAGGTTAAAAVAAAAPTRPAVEATLLTGPRDAKPTLISGSPPAAPDPTSTLKPSIVCRLLVDPDGRVADAKVYRSRLDLAAFEDAALDAVRGYRFSPGRLAGAPVPVWINWPVTFR
jgi:TonB family protein